MSARATNRTAVVTGGAAGIGQVFALRLAGDGHGVIVADVAPTRETEALIAAAGGECLGVDCDVASGASVAALAEVVAARFGRCDVLIANAGVYPIARFDEVTWEEWRRVMSINLDSLFHLTKAFLPGMRTAGWGRIVVMASNLFWTGMPGLTPYVASKGGAIGFVRSLAGEIAGDGITINAVAPSLTRTPGTTSAGPHESLGMFEAARQAQAIQRTQTPDDITGTLAFLVSDEAAFVTGQTLVVDGGSVRG